MKFVIALLVLAALPAPDAGPECDDLALLAEWMTGSFTDSCMVSWDRGFDGEGKQVWGAVAGGYIFRKIREQ